MNDCEKNFLMSDTFWTALSAIGTFLAVFVSLWLAKPHKNKKISLYQQVTISKDGILSVVITAKNTGSVPIAITELGYSSSKRVIDTTIKKYMISKDLPLIVKSGDLAVIEFSLKKTDTDYFYVEKQVNTKRFTVRDSEGKEY